MKYDLIGIILHPFNENVLFKGQNLNHDKDNKLTGKLSDVYGNYSIEGFLDLFLNKMNFDRLHDILFDKIHFQFFRMEGNLWIGKYGKPPSLKGTAVCELYETGKKPETNFEELIGRWKGLSFIKNMIDEGYLKYRKEKSVTSSV